MSDIDSLDELLDDLDDIKSEPDVATSIGFDELLDNAVEEYNKASKTNDDNIDDGGILGHMHSSEERAIDSSFIGVPYHLRKKWTEFLHTDISVDEGDLYVPSYAYRSWAEEKNKFSIDKSLKEILMKLSSICGLSDKQSKELEILLLDDVALKSQCVAQIILDRKTQILSDPNYDPSAYPMLANFFRETK